MAPQPKKPQGDPPSWADSAARRAIRGPAPVRPLGGPRRATPTRDAATCYTAFVGHRFLHLASLGGDASAAATPPSDWTAALLLATLLLLVLFVVVAVLMRGMRRRMLDGESVRRPPRAAVDPWAEAGRRIGRRDAGPSAAPGAEPVGPSDAPGDER